MTEKIAYIYCRTNGENFDSLRAQDERCTAWAEANGYKVEGLFDDQISGVSPDRPCFDIAVNLIADRADERPALIVSSIDRLSRDMRQFCDMREAVRAAGGTLLIVDQDGQTGPMAELIQNVLTATGELEAKQDG